MACNCGKPEGTCGCNKNCNASPAVLQINNPAEYATFHKVDVPIAFGDDTEYPALNGKYKNVILHYEKNGAVYIYSSDGIPTKLTYEEAVEALKKPYISLRRLGSYTYEITFDELPEYRPTNIVAGACSSFVKDGKLYRNFDWYYDKAPTFVVKAKGFTGIANGDKLVDGELDNDIALGQLPYRIVDGYNDNGIMMSTHVLFNDWGWNGAGNKTIQLQKLPYLILTRVKSMATIREDLGSLISNLAGLESEYLLQFVITDGFTTYALLPPQSATGAYELVDITSNPKLTNFRWVANETVERNAAYMQNRPTGVERWNEMAEDMSELRFTKAYEANTRLSEFIGINGTTKTSADSALQAIYETAHSMYANRSRNGQLWQTVHSVVYSKHGMEHLYTQENWDVDYIAEDDTLQEIVGDLLLKKVDYFEITDQTASEINKILNSTRSKIVRFTSDRTVSGEDLVIKSNTVIDLSGHTITFTDVLHGLHNFETTDEYLEYKGNGNIIIKNGTIIGGSCSFCHAECIKIENVHFLNCFGQHLLEMMSISGLEVKNCIFEGQGRAIGAEYRECIQIDDCARSNFPWFDDENNPTYDGTPNRNWVIDGCTFKRSADTSKEFYTAIGGHTYIEGSIHTNIVIKNNTMDGFTYTGIRLRNVRNAVIENNYIKPKYNSTTRNNLMQAQRLFENVTIGNNEFVGDIDNTCFLFNTTGKNIKVLNNRFTNFNTASGAEYDSHNVLFYIYSQDGMVFDGNIIEDFDKPICHVTEAGEDQCEILFTNNLINSKKSVNVWLIRFLSHGSISLINNTFLTPNSNNSHVIQLSNNENANIIYRDNIVEGSNQNEIDFNGYVGSYKNIYGVYLVGYSGNSSSLTNAPLSLPFTDFRKIIVIMGDGGSTNSVTLTDFNPRFSITSRTFCFMSVRNESTSGQCTLKLNSDNTFNFSTNAGTNLRAIYLAN